MSLREKIKQEYLRFKRKSKIAELNKLYKQHPVSKDKTFLFWVPGGYPQLLTIESSLAFALRMRGYNVHLIICNGCADGCIRRGDSDRTETVDVWHSACENCFNRNKVVPENFKLNYSVIGDYIDNEKKSELRKIADKIDRQNYRNLSYQGTILGDNVYSSLVKHYKATNEDLFEKKVIQEYAFTALVNLCASENAILTHKPFHIFMSHGVYVDWAPALKSSVKHNIPVSTYAGAYLSQNFFFTTTETVQGIDPHTVTDEFWNGLNKDLTARQKNELNTFLENRYKKNISSDMQGLIKTYKGNANYIYKKYNLKKDKPVWGILTHINWDNVSDFCPMLFDNFDNWLEKTIEKIIDIKDVQWLIKIHPSEKKDNPETGLQVLVKTKFPNLPEHIKLIGFDDDVNPFDLYSILDGAVTCFGTAGLELATMGKPIITAGLAHYSRKGFTIDSDEKDLYYEKLANASKYKSLSQEQIDIAKRYAYMYFCRRQIPLGGIFDKYFDWGKVKYKTLLPKRNEVIDKICDGLCNKKEILFKE